MANIPQEIVNMLNLLRGSSLMVKGAPGTGKTIFSLELLKELGENYSGIYVSTRVQPRDLYIMFPWLNGVVFEENIIDASCSFVSKSQELNKVIRYSSQPDFVKATYEKIDGLKKPALLVIDSWDAVFSVVRESNEEELARTMIDLAKETETNLIMVVEKEKKTGLDHLVDGIVSLKWEEKDGEWYREIYLDKLRGTEILQHKYLFTLNGGRFRHFEPFKRKFPRTRRKFKPIIDSRSHFSSGNRYLDEILGGGFPRGSYVFLETGENVDYYAFANIINLTVANFITQGRGVLGIPRVGTSPGMIKYFAHLFGFEDGLKSLLRMVREEDSSGKETEDFVLPYTTETLKEDFRKIDSEIRRLREETGEPVLKIVAYDHMESLFGVKALPEMISLEAQEIADSNALAIATGTHSTPETNKKLADTANIHLKIIELNGAMVLFGLKPKTGLYNIEIDISKGYPDIVLTPIR